MILFSADALVDIDRIRSFLTRANPTAAVRALATIWMALQRVEEFHGLGTPTADSDIRQIAVRFGRIGYVVRYTILPGDGSVLVLRLWHGREARK